VGVGIYKILNLEIIHICSAKHKVLQLPPESPFPL
jgi:hypothetical protein